MRLRAVILRHPTSPDEAWQIELQRRGHEAFLVDSATQVKRLLREEHEPFDLVVLDGMTTSERRALMDDIRHAMPLSPPLLSFWVADQRPGDRIRADGYEHVLRGPGRTQVLLRGDLAQFREWLQFLETSTRRSRKPSLLIQHSTSLIGTRSSGIIDLLKFHRTIGCRADEIVVDVLLPDGNSMWSVGQQLPDPVRKRDFHWLDLLARTYIPLQTSDITTRLTDSSSYPLAWRLAAGAPLGFSDDITKNVIKRLRATFRIAGFDDKELLPFVDGGYLINRAVVDILVEHIQD